jgi:L-threonylcarbamoyladenylate synthase
VEVAKNIKIAAEMCNTKLRVISCDTDLQNNLYIKEAAQIIKKSGLVAFPTETVYGLGANALDENAVKKIYKAKGRPSDNPLIVHVSHINQLSHICKDISDDAYKLYNKFSPGAITIVLKKQDKIPKITSGNLTTIGVRIPSNNIAIELIKSCGVPICAPSANISGKPSPTNARHVYFDLNKKIDIILDGGECEVGVESTVIDMTAKTPTMLRPGAITKKMIEEALGIKIDCNFNEDKLLKFKAIAPGMKYKHYAPKAFLTLINGDIEIIANCIMELAHSSDKKIGILATNQTKHLYNNKDWFVLSLGDRKDIATLNKNLFKRLREFDDLNVEEIFAEGYLEDDNNIALLNRLIKASSQVLKV